MFRNTAAHKKTKPTTSKKGNNNKKQQQKKLKIKPLHKHNNKLHTTQTNALHTQIHSIQNDKYRITNNNIFTPPCNENNIDNDNTSTAVSSNPQHAVPSTSNAFRPTTPQHKFTRIIDASLSKVNQAAKKKVAEEFVNSRDELLRKHHDNDEFFHLLDEAEAQAARHKSRIERKQRSKDTAHPFTSYNFSVTILGRPNVGKSSLFNRLTGQVKSMVHNSSGVTRDWNDSLGKLANLEFRIIDTAGLQEIDWSSSNNPNNNEDVDKTGSNHGKAFGAPINPAERSGTSNIQTSRNRSGKSKLIIPKSQQNSNYVLGRPLTPELQQSILDLTSKAIELSDIVIFMIDAKAGITQQDIHFARWVRKQLHTKNFKSTLKSIEKMMADGSKTSTTTGGNINIAQVNKLYELIAAEMMKDPEKYKNDITLFPIMDFFAQAHVDYEQIVHINHTNRSFLRSIHTKPVVLLANKYDHGDSTQDVVIRKHNLNKDKTNNNNNDLFEEEVITVTAEENLTYELHQLGFGQDVNVVPFSAVHGVGLGELYSKLVYSMSDVLKQWDTYQKKIKYIIDVKNEYDMAKAFQNTKEKKLEKLRKKEIEKLTSDLQKAYDNMEKVESTLPKPQDRRERMVFNSKQRKEKERRQKELAQLQQDAEIAALNDEEFQAFKAKAIERLSRTGLHDFDVELMKNNQGINEHGEIIQETIISNNNNQEQEQNNTKKQPNAKKQLKHIQSENDNDEQDDNFTSQEDDEQNDDFISQEDNDDDDDDDDDYNSEEFNGDDDEYEYNEEEESEELYDEDGRKLTKQERRKLRQLKKDELPIDTALIPDDEFIDVELPRVVETKSLHPIGTTKEKEHQVKFVLVGKPNAGKSTLMNAMLGEKRVLTGPQAGVTRDSIEIQYDDDKKYPKHSFHLVDTAGLKGVTAHKHSRYDLVDSNAMQNTVKQMQNAHVVGLVIDIAEGLYGNQGVDPVFTHQIQKNFIDNVQAMRYDERYEKAKAAGASEEELALIKRKNSAEKSAYDDKLTMLVSRVAGCVTKHDMDIARLAAEHGKALLILANKIDCLKGGQKEVDAVMKGLLALFSFTYSQNKGVTVVPISALHQRNVANIMTKVTSLYDKWHERLNTGLLNRWLRALIQMSPPPSVGMKPLNLKYITQTNTRPPTFALFVNRKADFPQSYERFIRNSLVNEFNLQGIPIRLNIRTGDNPYVEKRTISNADKFHKKKQREREEIVKAKQQRGGKNAKQVYTKLTRQAKIVDQESKEAILNSAQEHFDSIEQTKQNNKSSVKKTAYKRNDNFEPEVYGNIADYKDAVYKKLKNDV